MTPRNIGLSLRGDLVGSPQVLEPARISPDAARVSGGLTMSRTEGSERVPDSSVLRIFVLLSLLCVTGSALSDQGIGYGTYSYPADAYADDAGYGSPYAPYGNRSDGFGKGDMAYPPTGATDRMDDRYRDDSYGPPGSDSHRYGEVQRDGYGYQSNPAAGERMPRGGGRAQRFDGPRGLADGDSGRWGSGVESPTAAARGYRFRGDGPAGGGARSASTRRDGYRFRPLTDQEREKRGDISGWRPRGQERSGDRPGRPDPLPVDEAYGYESDNWFRRYYRGRP